VLIVEGSAMKKLLAGYIGGSSVDLARVRNAGGQIELFDQANYISKSYADLESILSLYLRKKKASIDVACFGVAGPVIKNEVSTTNLPWHIVGKSLEEKFSLKRVKLINDIVATAHGLSLLPAEKFYTINKGVKEENGNVGLIAAGAGLGEAVIYRNDQGIHPCASEGGRADFAPGNQIESELWEYLYSELGGDEVEDVVSLTGLERIFGFLVDTHGGKRGEWLDRAENPALAIIEAALSGQDETATRTLDIFINCYASEAANLALKGMTLGGIYIGGMIAPQAITALDHGRFMVRFVKKGKMERVLANMPVGVIIEEKTALLGAAGMTMAM